MALKEFYLDESLDWNVFYHRTWNSYLVKDTITDEDLVQVLKGKGQCSMTGDDDGPEFKQLRNRLEELGYIRCQRSWWNGDVVLKPFRLNGVVFKKDTQFCSGAAMKYHLQFERRYKEQQDAKD